MTAIRWASDRLASALVSSGSMSGSDHSSLPWTVRCFRVRLRVCPHSEEVTDRVVRLDDPPPVLPGPRQSLGRRFSSPFNPQDGEEGASKAWLDPGDEVLELLNARGLGLAHYLL